MAALVNVSCRIADTIGFSAFQGVEITAYPDLLDELPFPEGNGLYPALETLVSEVNSKIESVESI
jgi:hypothetical protein